jgi:DNA invertase Pin-like site-specific DNA recombinase
MERAIGYIRVSTVEQSTEGVSMDAQREKIAAYCCLNDLDLIAVYADNGVSAGKALSTREGGAAAQKALASGRACHIVSLKLDRLFRDVLDCLENVKVWDRKGVSLHLIDLGGQALNTGSAMGRFFLTMTAGFAELERGMTSERTTAALAHKKAHGKVYAPVPLGYRREGDMLLEDPDELATVTRIMEARAAGQSYQAIADRLNIESAPTKKGGKWYASTVRQVALNNLYAEIV